MKREFKFSILITIIAFVVYILCTFYFTIYSKEGFCEYSFSFHLFNIASNIMYLLTTVVTAWYVVFTYFLLKTTTAYNNSILEPYLHINWSEKKIKPDTIFSSELFNEFQKESDNQKWVILELLNTRIRPVTSVSIKLQPVGGSASLSIKEGIFSIDLESILIDRDKTMEIGVLNLAAIPNNLSFELLINKLEYTGEASKEIICNFSGERKFICNGSVSLVPTIPGGK
jgi:hypothetical protein